MILHAIATVALVSVFQDAAPKHSPLAGAIASHIEVLASDASRGPRARGEGEQLVLDYPDRDVPGYGLSPAAEGGTWLQLVPTIELTPQSPPTSAIMVGDEPVELLMQRDVMLWSPLMQGQGEFGAIDVDASEVVFVGHGTVAPE